MDFHHDRPRVWVKASTYAACPFALGTLSTVFVKV
jgi:hypothetical protein